jgi:hypothetical protein
MYKSNAKEPTEFRSELGDRGGRLSQRIWVAGVHICVVTATLRHMRESLNL